MNLVSGRCWIKAECGCRGQGCLMAAARWGVNALSIEIIIIIIIIIIIGGFVVFL